MIMSMREVIRQYQNKDKEVDDFYCIAEQACMEYPFSIAIEYGQGEVGLFLEAGEPFFELEELWTLSRMA